MMKLLGLVCLLLLLTLAGALSAQVAVTGNISGVVIDPTGATIPGANVTLLSPALMESRSAKADTSGSYSFTQLPPGTYEVKAAASGFKTYDRQNIVISAGFTATINLTLPVGEASETVEVSAAAPLIDTTNTQVGTTFDQHLLQNLPTGRDPWSTIESAPGVTTDQFDVGGSKTYYQSTMSVHGSKPGQMVYSLDGLKMNWPGGSGGSTAFYTDNDSVGEMQIISDSAPAEIGVGGVYINMVSKQGSNQVHGTLNGYYTTNALQSQIQQPTFKGAPVSAGNGPIVMLRDTTANIGAPIIKDRWWIYGGWRYLITSEEQLNIIRKDGSIPISTNHQTNTTLRNDFQVNNKNHLGVSWWYNEQNQYHRRNASWPYTDDIAAQLQLEPTYVLEANLTSQLSTNMVLDTRAGYLHITFPLRYEPQVSPSSIAVEDIALGTLTGAALSNQVEPAREWRFNQQLSYFKGGLLGSHSFKTGWEYAYNYNGFIQNVNGNIVAVYNNGKPFQANVYNSPNTEKSIFFEQALFAQDAWTIGRRVTLNLGVRYDRWNGYNPAQSSPQAAFFPQLFPVRSFAHQKIATLNNIEPRLGASWDIRGNGKSVLRASYSEYALTLGTSLGEGINPNLLGGYAYNWTDLNGDGLPQQNEFLTGSPVSTLGGVNSTIDPNLKRPMSKEVVVGYEQQIFGDMRVSANYYFRNNQGLIGRYNLAAPSSAYTALSTPIINPLNGNPLTVYSLNAANVGQFNYLLTNAVPANNNRYDAGEVSVLKRMSHNWQLLTGVTFQRNKGTYISGTSDTFSDPNTFINRRDSNIDQAATVIVKVGGQYLEPHTRISTSINAQHYSGYPIRPLFVTNVASNGGTGKGVSESIALAPSTLHLPSVDYINLRFSRPTQLTERFLLEPTVDLYNITNSNSITAEVATYGSNFLRPSDLINPRIVKFGLKLSF
jgi:hypothetical protein